MNLNLGIQPWAYEKPNRMEVRRTTYSSDNSPNRRNKTDPDYRLLSVKDRRPVYPPNVGIVRANTRGLVLEDPPAKRLLSVEDRRGKQDDDYARMISRDGKAFYPIIDKDHSRKVLASGMAVDDGIVKLTPTIEEMFAIILTYKKNINASDYKYWLGLENQYKRLMMISKMRKLTDSEHAIIANIKTLLIKELEKTTVPKHSTEFNDMVKILNSIAVGSGAIYSLLKIKEILSSLSSIELSEFRGVLENITLETLDGVDKLAERVIRLKSADAQKALVLFTRSDESSEQALVDPSADPSPSPGDPIASPTPSPIGLLSELTNSLSTAGKSISQMGLQGPVKDMLKKITDVDFQSLKNTLGLPDSASRKNLYNSIINIDLTDIYNSLSNIAPTNPVSLAGIAGLLTSVVKNGGFGNSPQIAANLQSAIGLLPAPELLKVIQVVGLPATSSASAIIPLLSTLGQSALWGLAISLLMTSLYREKTPAQIKQLLAKQAGNKLMPVDFDPSKPNVMIKKSDKPFATVQDIGFQSGQVLDPSSSWAQSPSDFKADPVYMDPRPLPEFDPAKQWFGQQSKLRLQDLEEWATYQNRPEPSEWKIFSSKLKTILKLIGGKNIPSDRNARIEKIVAIISKVKENPNAEIAQKAVNLEQALLQGIIKNDTTDEEIENIVNSVSSARSDVSSEPFDPAQSPKDFKQEEKKEELDVDPKSHAITVLDEIIDDIELSPNQKVLKALFVKLSIIKPSPLTVASMLKVLKRYLNDPLLADPHKIKQRNELLQLFVDNGFWNTTTTKDLDYISQRKGSSKAHGTLRYPNY